jgi:hypothetical protein
MPAKIGGWTGINANSTDDIDSVVHLSNLPVRTILLSSMDLQLCAARGRLLVGVAIGRPVVPGIFLQNVTVPWFW